MDRVSIPNKAVALLVPGSQFTVEISGETVVFDPRTTDFGGLHGRFHGRENVKTFVVHAETIILRGRLSLPGTDVRLELTNFLGDAQFLNFASCNRADC